MSLIRIRKGKSMQKPIDDVTRFHAVDQAPDPSFFTQFMDTSHMQQTARSYKQEIMQQLAISEGATILDIGCGTGQDTLDLARAVGVQGHVVGIDNSETMLREARLRADQAQLAIEYVLADATNLPFTDASFDGCVASRVLGHLQQPHQALAEMARVARPGAKVVVADGDLDTTIVDIPDRALARKIIHAACDQMAQGWIGRQLPRLFQQAGMSNIWVEGRLMPLDYSFFRLAFTGMLQQAVDVGAISQEELAQFWQALAQMEKSHQFFARVGGFIVSGRKPTHAD
jgi:ubiquinone/menaquinone biosynthesis C-methylase UbiE